MLDNKVLLLVELAGSRVVLLELLQLLLVERVVLE